MISLLRHQNATSARLFQWRNLTIEKTEWRVFEGICWSSDLADCNSRVAIAALSIVAAAAQPLDFDYREV